MQEDRDGLEPAYNPLKRLSNIIDIAIDTVINTVRQGRLPAAAHLESRGEALSEGARFVQMVAREIHGGHPELPSVFRLPTSVIHTTSFLSRPAFCETDSAQPPVQDAKPPRHPC